LDSKKFPEITFVSKKPLRTQNKLSGQLTIKGIAKDITLILSLKPDEGYQIIEAETEILREEFNLGFGLMDDLIGEQISISIKLYSKI